MDKETIATETQPLLSNHNDREVTGNKRTYSRTTFIGVISIVSVVCMVSAGFVIYSNGSSTPDKSSDPDLLLSPAVAAVADDCEKNYKRLTQDELQLLEFGISAVPRNTSPPYNAAEKAWMMADVLPREQNNAHKRVRKEVRSLTKEEWRRHTQAVRQMTSTYPTSESRSEYHIMSAAHSVDISPYAHFGPSFLPWHRVYLDKYESAITAHDPGTSLPYWDTVLDSYLPDYRDSVLWTPELFGPSSGEVNSGPFAGHENHAGYCAKELGQVIHRNLVQNNIGHKGFLTNPLIDDAALKNKITYRAFVKPAIANYTDDASSLLEIHHGTIHAAVGGNLGNVPCAAGDPIFFLWHASVDEIFEEFRQESQITNPEIDYYYESRMDPGYKPDAAMFPFDSIGVKNIWGLSNHFTANRYAYAARPSKYSCASEEDCGSPMGYLWCSDCNVCVSRVKEGGNCTGFPDRACYCANNLVPRCVSNTCHCII